MSRRLQLLLAVAVITLGLAFVPDQQLSVVEPVSSKSSITGRRHTLSNELNSNALESGATSKSDMLLKRIQRSQLIANPNKLEHNKDVFKIANWNPSSPTPPQVTTQIAQVEQEAAPPLNFKFVGKQMNAGRWTIFLSLQDRILLVEETSVIDENYRVGKITPPTMELIYIPLNQTQTLFIGNVD